MLTLHAIKRGRERYGFTSTDLIAINNKIKIKHYLIVKNHQGKREVIVEHANQLVQLVIDKCDTITFLPLGNIVKRNYQVYLKALQQKRGKWKNIRQLSRI